VSTPGPFRILIVEDDDSWGRRLRDHASKHADFGRVDLVGTRLAALEKIRDCHYHYISIDQNIPDRPREPVTPDSGLALCEHVVERHPFTNRGILTANGEITFSNRAGSLDGTRYIEKRVANPTAADKIQAMDARPYVEFVARELRENYLNWCLNRAGRLLPRALGGAAEQLQIHWQGRNWAEAIRALGLMW
jgi:ActR/RegA family two-component response regulator